MNEYLEQIAQLLVDSPDVPTDESDVADAVSIVQTVKNALDYLDAARDDNRIKREAIANLDTRASADRALIESLQDELNRRDGHVTEWQAKAIAVQAKLNDAHRSIGQLEAAAEREKHNARRWEAESHEWQARYEGMEAALRIVLEQAGVGK